MYKALQQTAAANVGVSVEVNVGIKVRQIVGDRTVAFSKCFHTRLEIRSAERGICPIATSTMNELFL